MHLITKAITTFTMIGLLTGSAHAACDQFDPKLRTDCLEKRVNELERVAQVEKVDPQIIRDEFTLIGTSSPNSMSTRHFDCPTCD